MASMAKFKIAGVQMDIQFGDVDANLNTIRSKLAETSQAGASLTVFPECTTTGYCFGSLEQARPLCEPITGPTVKRAIEMAGEFDTRFVFGFLESHEDKVYNSLALVDGNGVLGSYRKVHLPTLGIDRFMTAGTEFNVIELPEMRIGMLICYDSSFPEAARVLALQGADLIVLPTNWPPTSGLTADVVPAARALENHVYFMAINRVGHEHGFDFIGKSRICDPRGAKLDVADHRNEGILFAEIDPEFARAKHLVSIPGEHEVHRMEDRRPGAYGLIAAENSRSTG